MSFHIPIAWGNVFLKFSWSTSLKRFSSSVGTTAGLWCRRAAQGSIPCRSSRDERGCRCPARCHSQLAQWGSVRASRTPGSGFKWPSGTENNALQTFLKYSGWKAAASCPDGSRNCVCFPVPRDVSTSFVPELTSLEMPFAGDSLRWEAKPGWVNQVAGPKQVNHLRSLESSALERQEVIRKVLGADWSSHWVVSLYQSARCLPCSKQSDRQPENRDYFVLKEGRKHGKYSSKRAPRNGDHQFRCSWFDLSLPLHRCGE